MYTQWVNKLFKGNNNILFIYLVFSSVSSFIHFCSVSLYNCKLVFSLHSHHPHYPSNIQTPFSFVNEWIQKHFLICWNIFLPFNCKFIFPNTKSINNLNTQFCSFLKRFHRIEFDSLVLSDADIGFSVSYLNYVIS